MSSSKILRDKTGAPLSSFAVEDMSGRRNGVNEHETARSKAEQILKEARRNKESIEMEAYRKGLEMGQAEGQKMAFKRLEPLADTFLKALNEVESLRKTLTERHLMDLLEVVIAISEKIIHHEIHLAPDIILETIKAASVHLADADAVILRLHPSDYEYIREIEELLKDKLTGRKSISFVEDGGIDRGGVLIETELGTIDASIRSQIELIRDVLMEKT